MSPKENSPNPQNSKINKTRHKKEHKAINLPQKSQNSRSKTPSNPQKLQKKRSKSIQKT